MAGEIDFGDSECFASVRADQLVPGVWIEGERFGHVDAVLVQEVIPGAKRVGITAAHTSSGRMLHSVMHNDRMVDAWGKI